MEVRQRIEFRHGSPEIPTVCLAPLRGVMQILEVSVALSWGKHVDKAIIGTLIMHEPICARHG